MLFQLLVLAVHRQEVLGIGQGEHEFLPLLAGVAGHMHIVHGFVYDLSAQAQQAVDHLGDHLFVAGNGVGADDDEVPGAYPHIAVAAAGHAGQRAQRLALAAGGDQHDLLRRVPVDHLQINEHPFRRVQVAQFQRHLGVVGHAAAGHRYLAAVLHRQIDHLLDAVEVGSKGGNDNALLGSLAEQVADAFGHLVLGGGEARALRVGGVAQQCQHATAAVLGNGGQIGGAAGKRGVVDLEVAGLDHDTGGTLDGERHRVRNGVVHMDGLDRKAAQLELVLGGDLHKFGAAQQAVLFQLVLDQTNGEPGGVDGQIHLPQQIGQAADVILVAVGDDYALDPVLVLHHIGEIGDDQVDAEHLAVREDQAAVHQQHIPLTLIEGDVLAHFAQAAQGDDPHPGSGGVAAGRIAAPVVRPGIGLRGQCRRRGGRQGRGVLGLGRAGTVTAAFLRGFRRGAAGRGAAGGFFLRYGACLLLCLCHTTSILIRVPEPAARLLQPTRYRDVCCGFVPLSLPASPFRAAISIRFRIRAR